MGRAGGLCLSQQVFQLANLVSTEEVDSGEVIALNEEVDAQ